MDIANKMNRNYNQSFLILTLFLLLCVVSLGCQHEERVKGPVPYQTRQIAKAYKDRGFMTDVEYIELTRLQTKLYKTHQMNDTDIDLVEKILQGKPSKNNEFNRSERVRYALLKIAGKKTLTLVQSQRLYDLVSPYLKDINPSVRSTAVMVAASTRDPRAPAALNRLAQTDTDAHVVKMSKDYVKMLLEAGIH